MKNSVGWIILALIILIGVVYVINTCSDSNLPTEVPPADTIYVAGDTVWMPQDTVWQTKWIKIPAVTSIDSAGMVTKSVTKDTLLVMDKDSLKIKATAVYHPSEDNFDLGIDVDFRRYESFRVDTLKVDNYVPVEVKVSDPLWVIIAIVEFVVLGGLLVLSLIGG